MSRVMNTYRRYPVELVRGEGVRLFDADGNTFIDCTSGISVVNLGHSHPAVTKAICDQAETLVHASNLFGNPLQERLAERLSELSFGGSVFFSNSGAEANEAAIKLARIVGNRKFEGLRHRIVTMTNSFHGRTFATLSATGQDKIHDGFRPIADWFTHVPYNDFEAVEAECAKGDVVAVMLEPVQGEIGVCPAERGFLERLREFCTRTGILLIFDEIQTAMGRMGTLFGYQYFGVEPDVMTLAKALGNGLPIGAMIARPEIAEYLAPGTHGSTFGGNFLVSAAANAVLDEMTKDGFMDEVNRKGKKLRDGLMDAFAPLKATVRCFGMMCAVQLEEKCAEMIGNLRAAGVLVAPAAFETMRFYPPLTATDDDIDAIIAAAAKAVAMGV